VSLACVLVTSWISLAAKWPAGLLVGLTVSSCYLGSAVYIVLDVVVLGVAALVPFICSFAICLVLLACILAGACVCWFAGWVA